MKIGAIVLAAGGSTRLGQAKQLLPYHGQTLVRRAAEAALDAGCAPVAVVVGPEREKIAAVLPDLKVTFVPNEAWQDGIGSSIRRGVATLKDCDALIILACDQPQVNAGLLCQLMALQQHQQKSMVASAYAGTLGIPALFAHACFDGLLSLGSKQGAKALLLSRPNDVAQIDFPGGAIDIDTPADYQALLA